jgi:glutamyl-tRNA reductase
MRKLKTESYEDWLERIDQFERGVALQRLARGEDKDIVLEDFSKRITNKMKHALFEVIKNSFLDNYDAEKSRKDYENSFLNKRDLVPDHVLDD